MRDKIINVISKDLKEIKNIIHFVRKHGKVYTYEIQGTHLQFKQKGKYLLYKHNKNWIMPNYKFIYEIILNILLGIYQINKTIITNCNTQQLATLDKNKEGK